MAKIRLLRSENITITETAIMIVNSKDQRGYKTARGFVPFGGIFIECYNDFMSELSEIEKEMKENPDISYSTSAFDLFQSCEVQDIINFIESGILTAILRENIVNESKTLPFRVGLYNEQPTLYFAGVESDLMIYDVLMIKENDIKIKFCKDCGNAFLPNTKGLYCPHCKAPNVRNREKYRALKQDHVRLKYTRLQQRIQKREKAGSYRLLFEKLAQQNKNMEWLGKWSELDKKYQKIKRYYFEFDSQMSESEWNQKLSISGIQTIDDFQEWINRCQAEIVD